MTSSSLWHRLFLISLLLTRWATSNYPQTPLWKSQNLGVRLKHPLGHRPKGPHWKDQWRLYSDCTVPPPDLRSALPPAQGLQFLQLEKRAQGEHPASPVLRDASWKAHSGFASRGSLEKPVGFSSWGSEIDREGGQGLQQPALKSWLNTFLLIVMPEQKCQPVALPICRAKSVAPSGQFVQLAVLPDLIPSQWALMAVVYTQQRDTAGGPSDQRARPATMPNSGAQPVAHSSSKPSLWPCPTSGHSL